MKRHAVIATLLAASATARAQTAPPPPAPSTASAAEALRLELRDTVTVNAPGATSVFSVDPTVAEVSTRDGRLTIVGRGVGSTTISVLTATGSSSFLVTVVAPSRRWLADLATSSSHKWTRWEGNYESATERLTNSLEMLDGGDQRTLRAYAVNVLRLETQSDGDQDARATLPALSLEWHAGGNEVVVFDKYLEHSPLTVDGVAVRGAHLRWSGLELHAGVTSPLLYQNVFLTTQRQVVLGASYELRAGDDAFVPAVYSFPSDPLNGATSGTMASILYRHGRLDDPLQLRAELGWGGTLGAAAEVTYRGTDQKAWLSARYQPHDFAALGIGRPLGSVADGLWTAQPAPWLTANATATAARYEVGDSRQDVETISTEVRARVADPVAVSAGASVGRFRSDPMAPAARSITLPVGVHLEGQALAASAVYRYQINSGRNHGGHGGRLSLRTNLGELHASGFVDVQQEAATLEVILRDEPALAQLLNEMGLTATSPADLARLLRDNATLSQLGYVEGESLSFNPWRAQAGADVAWLAQDDAHQQLRLRLLFDRTQAVNGLRDTRSASLSYARRLASSVEATAMVSWWSQRSDMLPRTDAWSVAAGLRVRIDDVPNVLLWRRRYVEGVVVSAHDAPVPGVKVRLDGGRTMVSDAAGHFVFHGVEDGDHRVEAELSDDMYFTSPSRVAVAAGGSVRFEVAHAAAHLLGAVRDDLGAGIAGISFTLRGARGDHSVTTDSSGRFRVAAAEGEYVLDPVEESLPPGYDATPMKSQSIRLVTAEPAQVEVVLPANRSISGTVTSVPGAGPATVTLVELGTIATTDDQGRYVFRALKPGTYTVEAQLGDKTYRHTVEVAAGPSNLRGIDFP